MSREATANSSLGAIGSTFKATLERNPTRTGSPGKGTMYPGLGLSEGTFGEGGISGRRGNSRRDCWMSGATLQWAHGTENPLGF